MPWTHMSRVTPCTHMSRVTPCTHVTCWAGFILHLYDLSFDKLRMSGVVSFPFVMSQGEALDPYAWRLPVGTTCLYSSARQG